MGYLEGGRAIKPCDGGAEVSETEGKVVEGFLGDFVKVLTDIRNIQTSTGDISSNQRLDLSIPELLQSSLTLCLSLVGMQRGR
jgi:hypothetical protein